MGGSNGGLLVGATLTQRPDLAAAVVCSAPLLDMVRYERFGLGRTWNDEYGTAEDPTELGWLLGYSPYHAVREGTAYPAVLFTTFESDTRVAPAARPQAGRGAAARDGVRRRRSCCAGRRRSGTARGRSAGPSGWPPTSSPSSPSTPVSLRGRTSDTPLADRARRHLGVFRVMTRSQLVSAAADGVSADPELRRGRHDAVREGLRLVRPGLARGQRRRADRDAGQDPADRRAGRRSSRALTHRGIRRLTDRTATGAVPTILRPLRNRAPAQSTPVEQITERRTQRAEAIGSVLRSFASIVVLGHRRGAGARASSASTSRRSWPAPASSASRSGFGAQNLIKDFIAGIGIILEDQYGVGDVVDLGEASGTVEAVGLRITRLRDVNGVVWYVRNGEILRVGNKSQGFAQVVIDMPVAHDTDLERARTVMQEVADAMYAEEEWAAVLLAEPESLGVEQITAEGVFLRLVVRSTNADQWRVGRELRMRLKERFVAEGFRTPAAAAGTGAAAGSR